MESWNYVCEEEEEEEGKGFVSGESLSEKNVFMGWELGFSEGDRLYTSCEEHESSSVVSIVESSDLKLLGGFPPSKKAKVGLNSMIQYCQVHGCKKDLTSFKDYYRRHKVCEVHSKTVKVIVNGIEQRFCQQCSRFHLLSEFDDGKRSCRKRLAGHNERRRKPHIGRNGRLLQPYNGSRRRIQWNSLSLSSPSFICQDLGSSCITTHDEQKYNPSHWIKHIKIEDGSEPEISLFDKDCQAYPMTAKYLYQHDQGAVNSVSGISFQNISTGSEDFSLDYSAPTVRGLSTTSGHARSLLSSQSPHHVSSSQSPRIPFAQPTDVISCGKIYSVEGNHDFTTDHVDFSEGFFHESSEMMNAKEHISCDDGRFTMDLLQLSSQLQRVEQQRQSTQPAR